MAIKVFNEWTTEGIKVEDPGLVKYINLEPKIIPRTGGKFVGSSFHKQHIFIVERLINKVMVSGHRGKKHKTTSGYNTGKAQTATKIVYETFKIIESKLNQNPIAVFVQAVVNAAPREEVISITYGGARYPKAVECSPTRRIDLALRLMTQGAFQKSFNSKRSIVQTLADEIINAYNLSPNSAAISKKQELERQADSSR
jgi:small subunit ribosomal protein S7